MPRVGNGLVARLDGPSPSEAEAGLGDREDPPRRRRAEEDTHHDHLASIRSPNYTDAPAHTSTAQTPDATMSPAASSAVSSLARAIARCVRARWEHSNGPNAAVFVR